jgi:hypothetical protein
VLKEGFKKKFRGNVLFNNFRLRRRSAVTQWFAFEEFSHLSSRPLLGGLWPVLACRLLSLNRKTGIRKKF